LNFVSEAIYIGHTTKMGRGVFARIPLRQKTIIEIAPVIVMSATERILLDKTLLHDYIFEWGEESKDCCMALGYVPLYNHSYYANCQYEMNFKKQLITIKTVKAIKEGEELFINYNGDWDNKKTVWFDK
jgi:uncharacterized protein